MKVSFCTIVKNEERCLARCLESLHGIADEMIVVDTGSTDRTVEIAKSHGADVHFFEWIDDFSAAKNYALSKATGDWIIFIDADEYFPSEQMARNVIKEIERHDHLKDIEGLYHIIRNYMRDLPEIKESDYVDSSNCRIFRNRPEIKYENAIHEEIKNLTAKKGVNSVRILPESFMLHHDGYLDSLMNAKDDRNLSMELRELENGNTNPLLLYYIGRDYFHLKNYEVSLEYLSKYFDTGFKEDCFSIAHHLLHINAIINLRRPISDCFKVVRRGLKEFPNHPGVHLMSGFVMHLAHKIPHSIESFEQGFHILKTYNNINELSTNLLTPNHARFYSLLADNYSLKGDVENTIGALKRSLKINKRYGPSLSTLALYAETRKEEVLAFIYDTYDLTDLDDLKALLGAFSAIRPGVVFLTLFEKYFALTKANDVNMFTMMAVVGEYASAVVAFLNRYELTKFELYLSKALAFAIISDKPELLESVAACSNERYQRLALLIRKGESTLEKADLRPFAMTMHFALGFRGAAPQIKRFAERVTRDFEKDGLVQCALLYHRHNCANEVLEIVDAALQAVRGDIMVKGAIACAAMESAYMLGDFALALHYLELARGCGENVYRLGSFARFMSERLGKGPDKNKMNKLSQELFSLDLAQENERRKKLLLIEDENENIDKPIEIAAR